MLAWHATAAEPTLPPGIKTFSKMPRTLSEVCTAHENASTQACDYLQGDHPVEISDYRETLTLRDEKEKQKSGTRLNPSTRRPILTVGVEVATEDQARLPKLSAGSINDYLKTHYVSFQAKIQKDAKGALYLHQRPIAVTGSYGRNKLTEDFNPAVANVVRQFHSLGLFLPPKTPPTPENLRTVVMIHKHSAVEKDSLRPDAVRIDYERYEYLFVRARPDLAGSKLNLHVFATSDERRKLHYLKSGRNPTRATDCTLKADVMFTKYDTAGLIPAESAMRRQNLNANATFTIAELDAYTKRTLGIRGDALENLNATLDAIIDGKIKPGGSASPTTSTNSPSLVPPKK
jgi:hypothetical protein